MCVYYSYILSVLDSSHVAFFEGTTAARVLARATHVYRQGGLNFIRFRSDIVCVCVRNAFPHLAGALQHTRAYTMYV
jgi:hypothetical protein